MRDLTDLVRQATSQDGLLTTAQLRDLGFDRSTQRRLVSNGILVGVHRRVLRLAGAAPSWRQSLRAACLAGATASHRSALRAWGLRRDSSLEVAVRHPANRRLAGVRVHRSVDLVSRDITTWHDIPVTTPARTLCDAGLIFPPGEVQRLTDHAIATGLVGRSALIEVRRRVGEHGRNGVVSLDLAIDGLPHGAEDTDSGPEVRLLRLIADHGLRAPVRQYRVQLPGGPRVIDLAYPEPRLALEYDGVEPHTRVDRFVDDRRRQNELVLAGWRIVRFTNDDLRDHPHIVVRQIADALDL